MLAVLLAILGGVAMTAAAGARRTASSYQRFIDRYGTLHASVGPGGHPDPDGLFDAVATLPGVTNAASATLFAVGVTVGDHRLSFPDIFVAGYDQPFPAALDPHKILAGRASDPARADEAMVTYAVAERLGIQPGDRITLHMAAGDVGAEVTGIFVAVGAFETLTGAGFPTLVMATPAFVREHAADASVADRLLDLTLSGGDAGYPAFAAAIERARLRTDGPPLRYSVYTRDVEALNRLPILTLWLAAALLGLAAAAVVAQILSRLAARAAANVPALRALGVSRSAMLAAWLIAALGAALVAAVGAIGVAIGGSAAMPLGLARVAEPDPGIAVDPVVLVLGAAAMLLGVALVAIWPGARATRAPGGRTARRSTIAAAASSSGASAPLVVGVQMAVGGDGVPTRAATLGASLAIVTMIVAVIFAASFQHLAAEPRLAGYTWDAVVISMASPEEVEPQLPDEVAEIWPGIVFSELVMVDDQVLTARTVEGPAPAMLQGVHPTRNDEVAVDVKTLAALGKQVGDRVEVFDHDESGRPGIAVGSATGMTITGVTVVPRIPFQESVNAGQAAIFARSGLERVTDFSYEGVFMRFRPGVDHSAAVAAVREATSEVAFAVLRAQQVGAVRNVERMAVVPWVLAAVLAAVGGAALAHALASTATRRRKDIAVLKTMGFVSSQTRATLLWQGTILMLVALVVALPVGIVAGRAVWRAFAGVIAVVPRPVVPLAVAVTVPAGMALAWLMAARPAVLAARTPPAVVLRQE